MSKSRRIEIAASVLVVITLCVFFYFMAFYPTHGDVDQATPPGWVTDFETFQQWWNGSTNYSIARHDGDQCLLVRTEYVGAHPSGPPGYLFDRDGQLIDWIHDTGTTDKFIDNAALPPSIDAEAVEQWFDEQ